MRPVNVPHEVDPESLALLARQGGAIVRPHAPRPQVVDLSNMSKTKRWKIIREIVRILSGDKPMLRRQFGDMIAMLRETSVEQLVDLHLMLQGELHDHVEGYIHPLLEEGDAYMFRETESEIMARQMRLARELAEMDEVPDDVVQYVQGTLPYYLDVEVPSYACPSLGKQPPRDDLSQVQMAEAGRQAHCLPRLITHPARHLRDQRAQRDTHRISDPVD